MASTCRQEDKHYVGETGTEVLVEVGENITTATSLILRVKKPDGTLANWTGTAEGLTKIKYVVQPGDFDQAGVYKLQAYVALPFWTGLGTTTDFKINNPFT